MAQTSYRNIVILTGAGISQESGLGTFRGPDGLWENVPIEDVATPEGFQRDPVKVLHFYNDRRDGVRNAAPNRAHEAIGRLQRDYAGTLTLVTQNIDHLHEKGGATDVIHMHGEVGKIQCNHCGHVQDHWDSVTIDMACGQCGLDGGLRPHVVWFGEMPLYMDRIYDALAQCDLFISIGTSGNVYPAAGFVMEARRNKAHAVELNLEPSDGASLFIDGYYGLASDVVPAYVEHLLTGTPMPEKFEI